MLFSAHTPFLSLRSYFIHVLIGATQSLEELFRRETSLTHAMRTSGQELLRDPRSVADVARDDVRQRRDERGVHVRSLRPLDLEDPGLLGYLVAILNVQLVQGLDVFVDEGHWHQDQVLDTLLRVQLDRVVGVGLEPGQGAHLGLPDEPVRIPATELLHGPRHGGGHLVRIRVASRYGLQRQTMRREEYQYVIPDLLIEFVQFLLDPL